ncbi:MAG: glutamate--tRNA ligase [Antricoccus sp.]
MNDSAAPVRVRFCPSPTGFPHVGLMRTAMFNWAYARHMGGQLIFRIEDTDASRDSEKSYHALVATMRWLGLDWDEGPEVGGPNGPYRQSERSAIYTEVVQKLVSAGAAYESFSTPQESAERQQAAGRDSRLGYDNFDRELTDQQKASFRAEGREPVLRIRMPEEDIVWQDLVRGEVRSAAGSVPDFVIVRANGKPLYTFVNPLDDALMGVTHVLRGEDLLPSTPRQIALYEVLNKIGIGTGAPQFGHLPLVMGHGTKKLSKRDPEANFDTYIERGFVPEGMMNYLALLGWSLAADRDVFSPQEFIDAFDIKDVNSNPARFDLKKCEAINGDHIRLLAPDELAHRLARVLTAAGLLPADPTDSQLTILRSATPLVQERMITLDEAPSMLGFFYKADDEIDIADDARKTLREDSAAVLDASIPALVAVDEWEAQSIQQALRAALVDDLAIKPKFAFGPLRVAMSGRRISPPLFESMQILGRDSSLRRIAALRQSID